MTVYASSDIGLAYPTLCVCKICVTSSISSGYVHKIYITASVPKFPNLKALYCESKGFFYLKTFVSVESRHEKWRKTAQDTV